MEVYIVSHKKVEVPVPNGYKLIQVGNLENNFDGFVRDNSGDNISEKNSNYCELTAQYWIWKNSDADIKGLVHYRRFFDSKKSFKIQSKLKNIVTEDKVESLLNEYDILLPNKRNYYIETSYSHYIHAHKKEGLDVTRKIISEYFSEYLDSYDNVLNRKKAHMFNMMIAKKDVFDSYSQWLFGILEKVENNIDISDWNQSESRIYGYISELLLDVWLDQHKDLKIEELPVGFIGNQHWGSKIFKFLKRKIKG